MTYGKTERFHPQGLVRPFVCVTLPVYFAQNDSEFQEYLLMILEPFYTQLPWAQHCGV